MHRVGATIPVDPRKPGRFGISKLRKSGRNFGVIGCIAPANPVRSVAIPGLCTRGGGLGRDFDQQRQIGQQALTADPVQRHDFRVRQAARSALIGSARIDKPVTDHPLPRSERWQDQPLDMIGTRGGEQ